EYLLLDDAGLSEIHIDEDEIVSSGDEADSTPEENRYLLCASCGAIDRYNLIGKLCNCSNSRQYTVRKVKSKVGNVYRCPACGKQSPNSLVWRFLTGDDATASVLAESLFQHIPPYIRENNSMEMGSEFSDEDDWNPTTTETPSDNVKEYTSIGKRRLLVFSDSRQNAAFFAPYLSSTHSQILQRRLIMEVIETYKQDIIKNQWRVQDLADSLQQIISNSSILPEYSLQQIANEAWKWVFYELIAMNRQNSLEGLGCLGFAMVKPSNWQPPKPLLDAPWNLLIDEVWILFQILLDSIRTKGALVFPDNISPDDDFFKPRKGEHYFRENQSSPSKHIYSWCPNKGRINARLDFLNRLAQQLKTGLSEKDCRETLRKIWRFIHKILYFNNYFSSFNMKGEGTVYRMKYDFWKLQPSTINNNIKWYWCERCNNLTLFNLRKVCPSYRCDGKLTECHPEEILPNNHYRNLYLGVEPIGMRVEEHTAQLSSEAAAELQMQFVQGDVNVLSCSTTFELGVDVGELETVFMRNVPPSSANYVQRAGRAGRRTDSAAFALTFAQRKPHDLNFFSNPEQMVSGIIHSPHFEIKNEKIIKRHIYATAIASFWRIYPEMFKDVDCFFFTDGDSKAGPELLAQYLNNKPDNLKQALCRIVPEIFHSSLGIGNWDWLSGLLDENEGILFRCSDEVESDVKELDKIRRKMIRENKPSDYLLRAINTIKRRYLINFLSSRNVIPKYGFPVDVVELMISHHSDDAKRLELDRDLRIALSEYAPSSQVVAGGKLWTSRYLKRIPNREWPKYRYAVCEYCQCYQSVLADVDRSLDICNVCKKPLAGKNQGVFVIPEFGFIVSADEPQKPGEKRPERTYTTRTYYSGKAKEGEETRLKLDDTTLLAIPATDGQMAIINHAGYQEFRICSLCGYSILGNESIPDKHETPWRSECHGRFSRRSLGHEFKTDVLQLRFIGYRREDSGFWLSLLYAILEGASESLDIDRQDLDGCLYPFEGDPAIPALILFDDVPGGAGHVRRIAESRESLLKILKTTLIRLKSCDCGGEERNTSCYGCLRNYRNQFCHDQLNKGKVIDFLNCLIGY
ncbi:DUF1998 domain-containing protein, partial [Candidatus Poribacteria bacterium]|nr:DUF1998 domain-containing protein [Candidatus Poribacteria bacterium]